MAIIDVETVDAASTVRLLEAIEAMYPLLALIHVFVDDARYPHAALVQEWLAQPGRRNRLHFIPAYCPHLKPIERLWGVMHKHLTHHKTYPTYRDFAEAMLHFLHAEVPSRWGARRFDHRQLPHNPPRQFSHPRVSRYIVAAGESAETPRGASSPEAAIDGIAAQPKWRNVGQDFSKGWSQPRQSQTVWFDSSGMP
jgi:DDE superfamily endonuclease